MPAKTPKTVVKYRALTGMDYEDKRVEPGDIVSDLPGNSVVWLLEQGHIETVED